MIVLKALSLPLTSNEKLARLIILKKLSEKDYVIEFYDVGLLQSKKYPFLGVSPDAIVKIKIGDTFFLCLC